LVLPATDKAAIVCASETREGAIDMKVAYLTPLYFSDQSCIGGGERYPTNLATGVVHASKGGCRVELISYGQQSMRKELSPGVTLRVLRTDHLPPNVLDVGSWELPSAVREADVVHIHQAFTRSSEAGYLAAKLQGKPIVVSDHGGTSSVLGVQIGVLDMVDRVIAYSQFGANMLRTKTHIEIIRGGVDGKWFCPPEVRSKRTHVLAVQRLLPHKGIDRVIRALPKGLPLKVVGRPYSPDYLNMLHELARGKDVQFVTDADDSVTRELYRTAWVNVLGSVYKDCYGNMIVQPELMGLTLLESMGCGTPAICSRVGGMPEFVEHGETGFIYDTLDELTEYLERLATNPAEVERMGRNARESVEKIYDLRVCGKKALGVYREVSSRRPARTEAA